jgi:site-specific recombinase XerD
MLKNIYKSSWRLQWLRQAPLAESIDALAGRFHQAGYSRRYSQRLLWIAGKFNDHARSIGIETAEEVNDGLMRHFAEKRTHHGLFAPIAMHHFAKYLRDQGIVPTVAAPDLNDPCEPILRNYDEYLCDVRGLALTSRTGSLRYTRRFLIWLRNRHGNKFLDHLTGVDVLEFITELAGGHPSGSWRNSLCSYTRVFLRYLRWRGIIHVDLDRVVPKLPTWRLSVVPRHLPWEDVRKLIESVDTSRPIGLRDKAVLLLIAALGLRNQEVRSLQLADIVWRAGEIRLRETKSRRERALPLPREVGAVIAGYLLHGRPRVSIPQVFLRHLTPVGPITATHGVGDIVKKHLLRAGIHASNHGAHLLRHSLATRMVNQGVPIKQIADMLGHASIDTTAIYTKVDTTHLAAVALPFPGGEL